MPGVVIKFDAAPIKPALGVVTPEDTIFCPCDFRCDFEEKVFASDENDGIQNDFTDFLFKKITASDTILIEIIRDNIILAQITDDTYGTFYDGFDTQPLYVGWQADWTAIFNAFSGGLYRIRVTTTILGDTTEFFSRYFRLNAFDILEANKTVKIETLQNGIIQSGQFNFTDLLEGGWPTSIRLPGTFGEAQYELERDIYQDPSYREVQNRDQVTREFQFKSELIPESLTDRFATLDILGNQIIVTGYDVLQELKYEKFPVVGENFSDIRYDGLGRASFDITFSDRQKNIIKTNVQ